MTKMFEIMWPIIIYRSKVNYIATVLFFTKLLSNHSYFDLKSSTGIKGDISGKVQGQGHCLQLKVKFVIQIV